MVIENECILHLFNNNPSPHNWANVEFSASVATFAEMDSHVVVKLNDRSRNFGRRHRSFEAKSHLVTLKRAEATVVLVQYVRVTILRVHKAL